MEGVLLKKSAWLGKWNRRFVRLTGTKLDYWLSSDGSNADKSTPRGSFDIEGAVVTSESPTTLAVTMQTSGSVLTFCADDEGEKIRWMKALYAAAVGVSMDDAGEDEGESDMGSSGADGDQSSAAWKQATAAWLAQPWGEESTAEESADSSDAPSKNETPSSRDWRRSSREWLAKTDRRMSSGDRRDSGGVDEDHGGPGWRHSTRKAWAQKLSFDQGSSAGAAANESGAPSKTMSGGDFKYHPEWKRADGFTDNMTQVQLSALEALRQKVSTAKLKIESSCCLPAETTDRLLARFLRARNFIVDDAYAMLEADCKWRASTVADALGATVVDKKTERDAIAHEATICIDELHKMELSAVCPNLDPQKLHRTFGVEFLGYDRQGRPVVLKRMGSNCKIAELAKHCGGGDVNHGLRILERWHIWSQERCMQQLGIASARSGHCVEQLVFVIDCKKASLSLATSAAYKFLKSMARVDSDHYPERLAKVMLINCPHAVTLGWAIVAPWLDAKTQNKVSITRHPKRWLPLLEGTLGRELLASMPAEYRPKSDTPANGPSQSKKKPRPRSMPAMPGGESAKTP